MSHKKKMTKEDEIRKELSRLGNKFLEAMREEVDSCVILCDTERLNRLISIVHIHMDSEIIKTLREKGFDKEIRKLCDRAGRRLRK